MINESQILKALSKVSDPIKKKNLVSLKAIKQIKISKKLVKIEIQTSPSSFKLHLNLTQMVTGSPTILIRIIPLGREFQ